MLYIPPSDQHAATELTVNPVLVRLALAELKQRGGSAEALCLGLEFTPADLVRPGFRLSYFQASHIIRRVLGALRDPLLGLRLGMQQNMLSWGLVGFGVMAARTLRESLIFGMRFQQEAGFLLRLDCDRSGTHDTMLASPRFADVVIEAMLVDATFAVVVGAARQMLGERFSPHAVELVVQKPADAELYQAVFRCPVRFACSHNRMMVDKIWAGSEIPTGDTLALRQVISLLRAASSGEPKEEAVDAVIEARLRASLRHPPSMAELASGMAMTERSLRRKLSDRGSTYLALLDKARKTRALELIAHAQRSMREVADEIGFSDTRSLRRAFKRWTGMTLSAASTLAMNGSCEKPRPPGPLAPWSSSSQRIPTCDLAAVKKNGSAPDRC